MEQGKLLTLGRKVNSHRGLRAIRGVILTLLGSAVLTTSVLAATYRWTGDDGRIIYSQIPPQDGRPYTVIGAPPPPADAERERAKLDALRQRQADQVEDKELAAEKAADEAKKQAAIDANCQAARSNIQALEGSPNRLTRMPDGTVRRLTPEEREAKLKEAREYITENCR